MQLTPERERELVDKIAWFIVNRDVVEFAKFALELYGVSDVPGELFFLGLYPWISGVMGRNGEELVEFLCHDASEKVPLILARVEQLVQERKKLDNKGSSGIGLSLFSSRKIFSKNSGAEETIGG